MKIDLKKSGGDFSSVNTFPPKLTILLLDLSVLNLLLGKSVCLGNAYLLLVHISYTCNSNLTLLLCFVLRPEGGPVGEPYFQSSQSYWNESGAGVVLEVGEKVGSKVGAAVVPLIPVNPTVT
jgi:hypothetical protein